MDDQPPIGSKDPFPGFVGYLINIGGVTPVYALNAFCVYTMLYGRKINPFETHAGRVHTIGLSEVALNVFFSARRRTANRCV